MNNTDVEEVGDIKAIVISAVFITNIIVNTLTIAVLVRYYFSLRNVVALISLLLVVPATLCVFVFRSIPKEFKINKRRHSLSLP